MSTTRFDSVHPLLEKVIDSVEKVMIGKRQIAELSLVSLLADGHVLLEDVPGVGKTMMVKAIAKSVGAKFQRIQFTPDLLPSDLTGISIYNQKESKFEFRPGPIMGNIILADEINRTSPKTQSALLEGMEDGCVTVDGETHSLGNPFFVMATQNPIEYEGTFPLPEAQMDRFMMKLHMGYPSEQEELDVLTRIEKGHPIDKVEPVIGLDEILRLKAEVLQVFVENSVRKYMVDIVRRTRNHRLVYLGASPRGALSLMKAAQAYAFYHNRDYVVPDDVKRLAPFVLSHRIILKSDAKFGGQKPEEVIKEVLEHVHVPVAKERSLR
ncbi:MAG TPA: MoxR family ATPase [Bacillales bacterium]|nr:MoxR family ATPase [Bacillales bacterium]